MKLRIGWLSGWRRRSEWIIRLLRLSVTADPPTSRGLILIQIDGLSRHRLEQVMQRGLMPFLRRLQRAEGFVLHSHYSGLPSNTPGVQGELFFGVKTSVPAFSFLDRETGKVFRMYDPDSAKAIEERLRTQGTPLLENGSAYVNIFTGGAAEPHYCAADIEWRKTLRWAGTPLQHFLILVCSPDFILRLVGLMVLECVLAVVDCFRRAIKAGEWWHELHFIITRIGPVILLRELTVWNASVDITRGLPIMCINLIGYDDHAHRRGPVSTFARWPLGGIDEAIRRLWIVSKGARRRDYDVWVYSDHGQLQTAPFSDASGRTILQAVQEVCEKVLKLPSVIELPGDDEYQYWPTNVSVVASSKAQLSLREASAADPLPVIVTAMGPLGHIYPPAQFDVNDIEELARQLVQSASVPVVLRAGGPGEATAWTQEGVFRLPQDAAKIVGADHPFLPDVVEDLIAICHHPNAGAVVIAGWAAGRQPISFAREHGAHAGFGVEETHGFALLPMDAPVTGKQPSYLRPMELREAALRVLGRSSQPLWEPRRRAKPTRTFRMMTYNIHRCIGLDGKIAPHRIARVIARHEPDVIALQEVDVELARTHGTHQAEWLAKELSMLQHFSPTISWTVGRYGNAILSRYPMRFVQAELFPPVGTWPRLEPRGALWVEFQVEGVTVQVIDCHLSIWPHERVQQARVLMGPAWLGRITQGGPVILCGDFNAAPGSAAYKIFRRGLRDAQTALPSHRVQQTWSSRYPISRIDHAFLNDQLDVEAVTVPRTGLDQVASDHLPLVVDLRLATA